MKVSFLGRKAKGLRPLDPHWGRRPQTPIIKRRLGSAAASEGLYRVGLPPILAFFLINGVWASGPAGVEGAEPLAFLLPNGAVI
jgi:hypothetical protein